MHPARIQAELKVKGYRYGDIARECGVTVSAVWKTIHDRPFPSPKVRKEISRVLELDEDELWPDRKLVAA